MKKSGILMSAAFFILSAMVLPAAAEENRDAALVTAKCSACHAISRSCAKIGQKNAAEWETTVRRMVSKGAALNGAEQKRAIEFFAGLKKRTDLCPK